MTSSWASDRSHASTGTHVTSCDNTYKVPNTEHRHGNAPARQLTASTGVTGVQSLRRRYAQTCVHINLPHPSATAHNREVEKSKPSGNRTSLHRLVFFFGRAALWKPGRPQRRWQKTERKKSSLSRLRGTQRQRRRLSARGKPSKKAHSSDRMDEKARRNSWREPRRRNRVSRLGDQGQTEGGSRMQRLQACSCVGKSESPASATSLPRSPPDGEGKSNEGDEGNGRSLIGVGQLPLGEQRPLEEAGRHYWLGQLGGLAGRRLRRGGGVWAIAN